MGQIIKGFLILLAIIFILLLHHWLELNQALCQDALLRGRTDSLWMEGTSFAAEMVEADIKKYCRVIGEVRQWLRASDISPLGPLPALTRGQLVPAGAR